MAELCVISAHRRKRFAELASPVVATVYGTQVRYQHQQQTSPPPKCYLTALSQRQTPDIWESISRIFI
eukprot:10408255-Ditylum_brightwellii.AAC.1